MEMALSKHTAIDNKELIETAQHTKSNFQSISLLVVNFPLNLTASKDMLESKVLKKIPPSNKQK